MFFRKVRAGMLHYAASIGRTVERALVPNGCAFCGVELDVTVAPVCSGCFDDLPWTSPRFELPPFAFAAAPLEYAFPVDAAIKAMKFRRKLFYAPAFSSLLERSLDLLPEDIDLLLPVPLHWRRQMVRGFNQAIEIARPLAKRMATELCTDITRCRATPYQSGLAAAHRRRNLRCAFSIRGALSARHVLIVDDVITTGATCRELAGLVLEAGVETVSVLAIARAGRD